MSARYSDCARAESQGVRSSAVSTIADEKRAVGSSRFFVNRETQGVGCDIVLLTVRRFSPTAAGGSTTGGVRIKYTQRAQMVVDETFSDLRNRPGSGDQNQKRRPRPPPTSPSVSGTS